VQRTHEVLENGIIYIKIYMAVKEGVNRKI
jgi:hypothetical protein